MKFDNNFKQKVAYAIQDGLSMSRRVVRDEDDEYSNYKNFLKPDKVYNSFSGLFKADPSYQVFPLFRGSYKLPLILEEERGILFSVLSKSKYDSLFSRKSEEKIHLIDALTKYNNGYLQKNKQLSLLASSLRTGYSKTIAVIMNDISNPLFAIMVRFIEDYARTFDYNTFVLNTDESPELEQHAILSALEKKVDGIIICPTQRNSKSIELLKNSNCPFVLFGRYFNQFNLDYVISDDVNGAYVAIKHLITKHNCKRILFLNGPNFISSSRDRLKGYTLAHQKFNLSIDPNLIIETSIMSSSIDETSTIIHNLKSPYDGIFCFSDVVAYEVISILYNEFLDPHKGLPIIGYDNVQSNIAIPYPLTSIDYNKPQVARLLVDILINKMKNPMAKVSKQIVPTCLVERK